MMEVPASVAHLIGVNSEFAVLFCSSPRCRHAQAVRGIAEHLRKVHHEKPSLRKEAEEFGWELARQDARFLRDYTDVELPVNGSAPQHIVPVVDGFSCRFCGYLTTSRAKVRMHVTRVHSKPRENDDCIFTHVRLQSWYGPKRERYRCHIDISFHFNSSQTQTVTTCANLALTILESVFNTTLPMQLSQLYQTLAITQFNTLDYHLDICLLSSSRIIQNIPLTNIVLETSTTFHQFPPPSIGFYDIPLPFVSI